MNNYSKDFKHLQEQMSYSNVIMVLLKIHSGTWWHLDDIYLLIVSSQHSKDKKFLEFLWRQPALSQFSITADLDQVASKLNKKASIQKSIYMGCKLCLIWKQKLIININQDDSENQQNFPYNNHFHVLFWFLIGTWN